MKALSVFTLLLLSSMATAARRQACASMAAPERRRKSVPIGMDPSPSYGLAKQRAKIEGV